MYVAGWKSGFCWTQQGAPTTSQVVGQALGINAVWFLPEQATVKGEA